MEVNVFHALFSPGDVTGQFIAPPPTCPGDTFIFSCTVTGDMSGVTIWRVGGRSDCVLPHSTTGAVSTCGFTAASGTGFGTTNATSYSSTLSDTASHTLNGILVECFGPGLNRDSENRIGNSTLHILGQ